MDNKIQQNLALPYSFDLFKAYSVAYDRAKQLQQIRFIISYVLSIILPLISIVNADYRPYFSIIGGIWAMIAFFITIKEKDKIKEAAKIQDEFDTRVFDLMPNETLVGSRFSEWRIKELSAQYKGNEDIKTWYGNLSHIPYPLNILTSQRSNIIWDWRLRKSYFTALLIALIALFLTGIIVSLVFKLTLAQYIISVFLPGASAFILGIKELLEHYDNYTSKQKLESKLNGIIEKFKKGNNEITDVLLRQFQDVIFLSRKCTALVPTWYYNWKKDSYNERMQTVLNAV
ncbi:hypothetical protein SAMN05444008_1302 [Cnuella takakiae]|uniref:Uncharacterized protein n=1 Tax=Cnuella takakiae TaxID=1302690 RepID=A0A1M5JAF6_9BACT|nr:S-4TM family putative pore-forming effector [Cnuella takakiae]OLY95606.1 hypothetical protein BUE76_00460 [Cnuella takakiae]SHG37544.1 hypothetical protein SAMN05444008_1302 [Cnuella takakiae]